MATTIRPELSEKNPYWIEKHRYYELKHFCLQYPIWQKQYSLISNTRSNEAYSLTPIANQSFYDSTGETAVDRTYYSLRIRHQGQRQRRYTPTILSICHFSLMRNLEVR